MIKLPSQQDLEEVTHVDFRTPLWNYTAYEDPNFKLQGFMMRAIRISTGLTERECFVTYGSLRHILQALHAENVLEDLKLMTIRKGAPPIEKVL